MEILTGLFIIGLYKATEKIWEKGFDAAWEPVGEALKERFTRWAGRDKESQRWAAFVEAADRARRLTVEQARGRETTQAILEALDAKRNKDEAQATAEEGAKLMLFSAHPDVETQQ
ncbi:MAG: hypothetical protein OEW09_06265 [Anaerolineae bacterium]|nr:hypothetical protein [Anaerolineae bacterium]